MIRALFAIVVSACLPVAILSVPQTDEVAVKQSVESFYSAFNGHNWTNAGQFATADWNHINPFGGWTKGRESVLRELHDVHSTFLKGVSDKIEEMSVQFASSDVAIVVVPSKMSTFVTPDGVRHENERHIRTFVVVKREGRWLIMHDQNTAVSQ